MDKAIKAIDVFAVQYNTWDGTVYQKLFKSEANAKTHMRDKNRESDTNNYEVKKLQVEE